MGIPHTTPTFRARDPAGPWARLLSNGRLTTLVTAEGTGVTDAGGRRITAWTPDAARDCEGLLLYVRDEEDGALWSLGLEPVAGAPERYAARAEPGVVRIERSENGIELACEIAVAEADADLRGILVRNASGRARRLSLTTCAGLVVGHAGAHAAHPAFSKLFVQTRIDAASGVLRAQRRPRGDAPEPLHVAHALHGPGPLTWESDRARFLGRGRSAARPAALAPGAALSGTVGSVLDPVAALRRELELAPGAEAWLCAVLACAPSESEALALAQRFAGRAAFEVARDGAAARARATLAELGLEPGQAAYLEVLLARALVGLPSLRAPADVARRVRGTPEDLWVFGLPPERPLVVAEDVSAQLAAELALATAYWERLGVPVQVLVLGDVPAPLRAPLVVAPPGSEARHLDSARACARIHLRGSWPALASAEPPTTVSAYRAEPADTAQPAAAAGGDLAPPDADDLQLANGCGGFASDGREYAIDVPGRPDPGAGPPLPWINVLAHPDFGSLVSERGAATTWSRNSREHRLTPWSNDPVLDPHGEALWLRDEGARVFWSPQPGPTPGGAPYRVRHGFGYSSWSHASHGLLQQVTTLVAPDAPVKLTRVRVTNPGDRTRSLSLFTFARLVLGVLPEDDARAVVVDARDEGSVLLARNGLAGAFAGGVAFASLTCDGRGAGSAFSADRRAFLGPGGSLEAPRALVHDERLDGRSGAPLDACFAHQLCLELAPAARVECVWLLGEAEAEEAALDLVAHFAAPDAFEAALAAVREHWRSTLEAVQVETPSPALDVLANGWLAYQTLACRLWGRSAFYQSGGAFGYRDQLQDAAALVYARPDLTRAQILLHAAHQFEEGDVLHWWHPPQDRGTRTRFADDLLWLPYVAAHYVATTGDRALLDERAPFVRARALAPGEDEAYLPTERAEEAAPLYEHCCRAIDRSLRVGAHGLPLMGAGDWNDGMNRVGREGRGESVWMAFFLIDVLRGFAPLCAARGDAARARRYADHADALAAAVEAHAWDGAWYRRAWFDDGTPLGTADARECRIDVLPQAWAVLSGAAPRARAEVAMDAVLRELALPEAGLIRLLAPPFERTRPSPGYIQGYVAGIRENGGQYTHAALWAVRALAELGRRDAAFAWLERLLPSHRARTPEEVGVYRVEPYAVAADVYAVSPHVGRGGWTWYTGSSGWMLRVALESVLGLRVEDGRRLVLRPCVPDAWPGFRIDYRVPGSGSHYAVVVRNPSGCAARVLGVRADGAALEPVAGAAVVPLAADGARHEVEVELGR